MITSSLLLGAATGLRSSAGTAAVALTTASTPGRPQPLAGLASTWGKRVAAGNAALEFAVDKHPRTPRRTSPPGLGARLALGALSCAALAQRSGADARRAAAVGGGSAVVAAFGGLAWRRIALRRFGSDWPGALIEDAVSAALSFGATRV